MIMKNSSHNVLYPPSVSSYFIEADKSFDIFEEIFKLGKFHDYVSIGGDLNLQDVDWDTRIPKNGHVQTTKFIRRS